MRARLTTLCAGLVFLAACQTPVGTTGKKPGASSHSGSPEPLAVASAPAAGSAAPGTSPTPKPAASGQVATAAAVSLLQAPPGASSVLKGVVRLDASYIVAQGAGNIISGNAGAIIGGNASAIVAAGGGNIVAQGAGNVISGNAGTAIANASGQIVAQGAGNVISGNGGAIIGGNGGAIVAQGGGNIVAQGAGNIVAQGAGNIVAQGAGNRRLLQEASNERLPVAGMPLTVVSLATHQPVPVGVDGDGKPVYTVYTNAQGGFELWLPPEQQGNVLVLAQVQPEAADPRLSYGLVAEAGNTAAQDLDEDTALLTTYVRRGMGPFLSQGMLAPDTKAFEQTFMGNAGLPDALELVIDKEFKELRAAAELVHVDQAPEDEVRALVQRMVDQMITHFYMGTDPAKSPLILTRSPSCNYWHGPDEPAVPAMADMLRLARIQARAKLAADPGYFDHTDYVLTANAIRQADGLPAYHIQKDSDLINFLVDQYFTETDPGRWAQKGSCHVGAHYLWGMLEWVFEDLGMQTVDHVVPLDFKGFDQPMTPYTSTRFGQSDRGEEAFHAFLARGFLLLADTTPGPNGKTVHDEIFQILADFKPSSLTRTSPTPRPVPDLPCKTPKPTPVPTQHGPDPCTPLS